MSEYLNAIIAALIGAALTAFLLVRVYNRIIKRLKDFSNSARVELSIVNEVLQQCASCRERLKRIRQERKRFEVTK